MSEGQINKYADSRIGTVTGNRKQGTASGVRALPHESIPVSCSLLPAVGSP
jgi:hypothetical protein